ncbi:hypothetical protein ACHAWF_009991 [Thalassiosira exigua]
MTSVGSNTVTLTTTEKIWGLTHKLRDGSRSSASASKTPLFFSNSSPLALSLDISSTSSPLTFISSSGAWWATSGAAEQRRLRSMLRKMSSGSSINLMTPEVEEKESSAYDNSKQLRRSDSSFYEQARSLSEICASIRNDFTWALARDFVLSLLCFLFGVRGPKAFILPLMGGLTIRPIPYQVSSAGDVLLDLTLANEFIPKTVATFTCTFWQLLFSYHLLDFLSMSRNLLLTITIGEYFDHPNVPAERLWFVSLWLPLSTVVCLGSVFPLVVSTLPNNNPLHNIHAGVCTLLVALGISELVTQVFKFYVGRLRPNFYGMCGFDKTTLQCMNGDEMEMEARMSFPSGHSSFSFCGLLCVVLFFLGRVGLGRNVSSMISSGRGRLMTAFSFTPMLLSFWCATSRLVDNWHHPSDIIAGAMLGAVSACVSYHIWFPHILSAYAGVPLSVIRIASSEDTFGQVGYDYLIVEKSVPV